MKVFNKKLKITIILCFSIILLLFLNNFNLHHKISNKYKVVLDTKMLQNKIDSLQNGDTLTIPKGTYNISQLILKDKNNIKIKGLCTLYQTSGIKDNWSYNHVLSQQPTLVIKNCNNIKIEDISIRNKYEAIYIENSPNTTISNVKIDGQNLSTFSGIFINSSKVKIKNCKIENCSTKPKWDGNRNTYTTAGGNGIQISTSKYIYIENNEIVNNAMNGVFVFASSYTYINNNKINSNGMSGIQIAFASGDKALLSKNYKILNNTIENNYSDGIDINNRSNILITSIKAEIINNHLNNNGFINNHQTQDGSGIATLIGIKDVLLKNNITYNCSRAGIYMYKVNNINITSNNIEKLQNTKDEGIYVEDSKNIYITNNTIKTANKEGIKLFGIVDNIIISKCNISTTSAALSLPTNTKYNNVIIKDNILKTGKMINNVVDLTNNYISQLKIK